MDEIMLDAITHFCSKYPEEIHLYCSVAASHSGMLLKTLEYFLANFKIVLIAGCAIQEVGRLYEFRSQQMLTPMNL